MAQSIAGLPASLVHEFNASNPKRKITPWEHVRRVRDRREDEDGRTFREWKDGVNEMVMDPSWRRIRSALDEGLPEYLVRHVKCYGRNRHLTSAEMKRIMVTGSRKESLILPEEDVNPTIERCDLEGYDIGHVRNAGHFFGFDVITETFEYRPELIEFPRLIFNVVDGALVPVTDEAEITRLLKQ